MEAWQKIAAVNAERERAAAEQAETAAEAEQAAAEQAAVEQARQVEEQARLQAEAEERAKMQAEAQAEQTQAEEQEKPAEAEERAEVQAERQEVAASDQQGEEIKPIGKGPFGDIYDQFKGKAKEAFDFLLKKKSGYLVGVFHRDEIGDIDLAYGEAHNPYKGKGLAHIIKKHVETLKDFNSADDAIETITDVIENGEVKTGSVPNTYDIEKGDYRVVVASDENGNWVLTAFDYVNSAKEKKKGAATALTPSQPSDEAGAVTSSLSTNKDTETSETSKSAEERTSSTEEIADEAQLQTTAEALGMDSEAQQLAFDTVTEMLQTAGIPVEMVSDETLRQLAERSEAQLMAFGEPYDYDTYPRGRVEPSLESKDVQIVQASAEHGFKNFDDARTWARESIAKTYNSEESGGKGDVRISNSAIDKFLSQSSTGKSDNLDVHFAVLKVLPEVLKTSLDVETHPDFEKDENGIRRPENGYNKDVLVHRCYGAVSINGETYRVKITLKEDVRNKNLPHKTHSYEATKIELLAGTLVKPGGDNPNTNNSIAAAKLLKDVEMSYIPGKKVLDASKERSGRVRYMIVRKGDLTDKELNALINHIEESLKSIPEKSTDELYGIIRQISEMNHNATKGYGRLTDYEWQNNTRIYTLKSEGLNAIVPELLSRGEHIGYNAGDGIVYFRDGQGRQISFHGYTPERAIENELDKNVEWDGKTEAWRNDDDLEVKRQRATMRQQIQEEISSLQEQKYKLESESKAKIKAARIERFGQQWSVDDNTASLTYVNDLGERVYPIDYSNSKNARKSDLQKAAELCPEMEEPISAYIEKDKALNDHWSTIWRLDEEKRKAQNSLQRSRKPESIENAQKTFAEIEETLNTLYKEIGNKKQEKQKAWELIVPNLG